MVSVAVGGDENLSTRPSAGGEFQSHLMSLLRSNDFRGFEGLYILVEVDSIHFSVSCFGGFELQNGIHPITVDAADEPLTRLLVPGFILSHAVVHNCSHGTKVLLGFPDISHGSYAASPPRLMR